MFQCPKDLAQASYNLLGEFASNCLATSILDVILSFGINVRAYHAGL